MKTDADPSVLRVNNLCVDAQDRRGNNLSIVRDISFSVEPGKVTALIGESGSGKTTIALACLGYSRAGCRIVDGQVQLGDANVLSLPTAARRKLRGPRGRLHCAERRRCI